MPGFCRIYAKVAAGGLSERLPAWAGWLAWLGWGGAGWHGWAGLAGWAGLIGLDWGGLGWWLGWARLGCWPDCWQPQRVCKYANGGKVVLFVCTYICNKTVKKNTAVYMYI